MVPQPTPNINPADKESFHFAGLSTPNTTAVPDDFFDVLAPNLSEAELRVLIYIIRRTFGFKKDSDTISLTQMVEGITTRDGRTLDRGTGMSRAGVAKGVKGLEAKGIVFRTHNSSREKGHETTAYQLCFRSDPIETTPPGAAQPPAPPSDPPSKQRLLAPAPPSDPPSKQRLLAPATTFTSPSKRRLLGLVNVVYPQETVKQETVKQGQFENSNCTPGEQIVDNRWITPYLDHLIVDLSREFGDTAHCASNCKQARNVLAALDLSEEIFVEQYVYPARQTTKQQAKVRNKMAYFFATLRESCGLNEGNERGEG